MRNKKYLNWRWSAAALSMVVLSACGGGGGAGTDSGAGKAQAQPVVVPDFQYAIRAAVLNAGVQQNPSNLTKDAAANAFTATGGDWSMGQVFVFQGQMYKIVNILANADRLTTSLTTTPATLDETFTDLEFNYTLNPVNYDSAGKFQTVTQTGLLRRIQTALQLGLSGNGISTDEKLACLIPSQEIQLGETFGIEYKMDCSLSQLMLDQDDSTDGVRLNGTLKLAGEAKGYKNIKKKTDTTDRTTTADFALTAVVSKGSVAATTAWAKGLCEKAAKLASASLNKAKCEVEDKDGEVSIKLTRPFKTFRSVVAVPAGPVPIPVPVYLTVGVSVEITFSVSGEATIAATVTHSMLTGYIDGRRVSEDMDGPKARKTGVFSTALGADTGAKLNGELDAYIAAYVTGGMGNENVISNEATIDVGPYWTGTAEFPPPCLKSELGMRGTITVTVAKSAFWDGYDVLDETINSPLNSWTKTLPAGCDAPPGAIKLKYSIVGKNNYTYDDTSAGTGVDIYVANYALIHSSANLGTPNQFTIDLENTVGIADKALVFEAIVLDTSKGAFVDNAASLLEKRTEAQLGRRYRAVVRTGDTGYEDSVKMRISSYVPGDRDKTIKTRDVTVRIEPPMTVSPTFSAETTFYGDDIYRLRYEYLGQTALLLKSGYIEMENGMREDIAMENGAWKTTSTRGRRCNPCKPTKLVLFSRAGANGEGQIFPFVEETGVRVSTFTVDHPVSSVGDRLLFTLEGRRIPSTVQLNLPFCGFIEEETLGSTERRVFSCRTNAAGKDLVASVTGVDSAIVVYSVNSTCPVGQVLQNGVCATPTPVPSGNLVANGSFETGDTSGWQMVTAASSVGVISDYGSTQGLYALNFAWQDSGGAVIEQSMNTVAGAVYKIEFDWKASHPTMQNLAISIQGASGVPTVFRISGIGQTPFSVLNPFQHYSFTFTASDASTVLRFTDESATSFQVNQVIDNVAVTACSNGCTP